jgi:hypothetical protein
MVGASQCQRRRPYWKVAKHGEGKDQSMHKSKLATSAISVGRNIAIKAAAVI